MSERIALRARLHPGAADLAVALFRAHGAAVLAAWWPAGLTSLGLALLLGYLGGPGIGPLTLWLLGPYASAPVTRVVGALLRGDAPPRSPGAILDAVLTRLRGLFHDLAPFALVATLLGSPLALVVWAGLPYTGEVLLLEPTGTRIWGRSGSLARAGANGIVLRVVEVAVVAWLVLTAESTGQFVVGSLLQSGAPWGRLVDGVETPFLYAGLLAAQPAVALVRAAFYLDARVRIEALDRAFAVWDAFGRRP
jgi:hypothetical protein